MANQPRITAAVANAMLDAAIGTQADLGKLRFYDGTQPPAGGGATTNMLAELTMAADAFPAAGGGALSANAITQDSSIDLSGTATWARLLKSDGTTTLIDLSVGTSGCDINLSPTNALIQGGTLSITSFVITHPLL